MSSLEQESTTQNTLSRKEITAKLDELGVQYNKHQKTAFLENLLTVALTGTAGKDTSDVTTMEVLEKSVPTKNGHKTPGGVIAPYAATRHLRHRQYEWTAEHGADKSAVFRGNKLIRTYSKEVHGKDFKKLAEQICTKKNKQEKK